MKKKIEKKINLATINLATNLTTPTPFGTLGWIANSRKFDNFSEIVIDVQNLNRDPINKDFFEININTCDKGDTALILSAFDENMKISNYFFKEIMKVIFNAHPSHIFENLTIPEQISWKKTAYSVSKISHIGKGYRMNVEESTDFYLEMVFGKSLFGKEYLANGKLGLVHMEGINETDNIYPFVNFYNEYMESSIQFILNHEDLAVYKGEVISFYDAETIISSSINKYVSETLISAGVLTENDKFENYDLDTQTSMVSVLKMSQI